MKFILLLAFAISVSSRATFGTVFEMEWDLFKLKHSKVYKNHIEETIRKKLFYENKLSIYKHNELYELGQVSYTLGVNEYSDLGYDEFLATMTGYLHSRNNTFESDLASEGITFIEPEVDAPSSFDWREKGAVTGVKNQGQCGSCWAFSAIGAVEAQHFRKTKKLVSLSEQNLVDCSSQNHGCHGGWPTYAFQYIINNRGIDTEDSYRYEARDSNCRYNPRNSGATIRQYDNIPFGDENALEKAVALFGPVSVAIDVPNSFMRYRQGVYSDNSCDPKRLVHAVLVVGYGSTENGQDYWIVKNSWGTSWGDKGYVLMARNKGNSCGIASQATYPRV